MKLETELIRLGRGAAVAENGINVPVHRASTILFDNLESYIVRFDGDRVYDAITYGSTGTQNTRALAEVVQEIEGGGRALVTATGVSAITIALMSCVQAGDHLLVTDSVYGITRGFCRDVLARFGVTTTYFDPALGAGIRELIRDNTRVVVVEAPGSCTFEMQDIPAIAAAAHDRGVLVAMDNTWATPLYFRPLDHGVDLSIQAGTKYLAGHSDVVLGVVTARDEMLYRRLRDHASSIGDAASPDDCFLALRGLRTLSLRLGRHQTSARKVAEWLTHQPEVQRVMYPALADDPGHALWKRDFKGASGLMAFTLRDATLEKLSRMLDHLSIFQIGSSWGGFESLVRVDRCPLDRQFNRLPDAQFLVRIHVGLEEPDDLIEDLKAGFERYRMPK